MASNRFGTLFSITTWGESHGKAIGVVIDGCPAGLPLTDEEINTALKFRAGGKTSYVTPRSEKDEAAIYSGVFEGKTTGAPLSIIIFNHDADSSKYEPIKDLLRPGHANFTYLEKYGIFDYRGGGRSSARETACRVAAGAVAKKLLAHFGITAVSYMKAMGDVEMPELSYHSPADLQRATLVSRVFCPHSPTSAEMICALEKTKEEGDSLGGIVETLVFDLPIGWGDPVYEKLEANLAKAMLSIPASKGFEIGSGFAASKMQGSEHNDAFVIDDQGKITTATNFAGGTLGGISTGLPLITRTAFKPTSSIQKPQKTLSLDKEEKEFKLPEGSRHDPCVTIRAVPVVEAMTALVLVDAFLMNRSSRI